MTPPDATNELPQELERLRLRHCYAILSAADYVSSFDDEHAERMRDLMQQYAEAYAAHKLAEFGIVPDKSGNGRHLYSVELAEMKRDSKRLDWLATQCYLPGDHPDDGVLVVVSEKYAPLGSFTLSAKHDAAMLRMAIDSAMQGGPR